jgi:pSer/pThr/pTyr-binding forkhead associated (FHA) protein
MSRFALLLNEEMLDYYIFEDAKPFITIGRHEHADIPIPNKAVSRRHAKIVNKGGQLIITDCGATNGVFIKGRKIESTPLTPGDEILIGKHSLKYVGPGIENAEHLFKIKRAAYNRNEAQPAFNRSDFEDPTVVTAPALKHERARAQKHSPRFEIIADGKVSRTVRIEAGKLTIGKDKTCDIKLSGILAPKAHSEIENAGAKIVIRCLSHKSKLLLNGAAIKDSDLIDGDVIQIDELKMIFRHPAI